MAYVITQNCCKDASCVPVCPVDCIRPVGGPGEFTVTEMLYIDPESCIDCGACMDECPVDAIHYEEDLPPELARFKDINAAYFERHPLEPDSSPSPPSRSAKEPLRVAIVGAGPAACYAAAELIDADGVEVDLFEKLPTPFGLIRAGVAPDHQHTKSVADIFEHVFTNQRVGCHLNVEVGRDLTHGDLLEHHHAVIYAVGASNSRALGIPGEHLAGNHAAAEFVGWYNGHPDHADRDFDLTSRRAVIIGNGNVALDIARVLLMDEGSLAATDIAEHALNALVGSAIEEVVILGRRGPRFGAFSAGELLALGHLEGVDVAIDGGDLDDDPEGSVETALKLQIIREYVEKTSGSGTKRIVFRFDSTPVEIVGDRHADGIRVTRDGDAELLETSLILRSIGYHGSPVPGLPHDPQRGVVPNEGGRVVDDQGNPVPGVYVTGWIKRGPRGVIGTNRICAHETVAALWQDFTDGGLKRDVADRDSLLRLLADRGVAPVGWQDWRTIDAAERNRGTQASRPRVKFVAIEEMLATVRA
jgi:ferredoxin/flavodoxin---NADP+ reductase